MMPIEKNEEVRLKKRQAHQKRKASGLSKSAKIQKLQILGTTLPCLLEATAMVERVSQPAGAHERKDGMQEGQQRETQLRTSHHMAKMNDDIITEILYRLPVKSVYRLKCVSKGWLSLISHPLFFQNYFLHHKIPSFGVFLQPPCYCMDQDPEFIPINYRNTAGVPNPSFTSLLKQTGSIILHACNGLLLCSTFSNHNYSYFICNPTTMEYTPIPAPKGLVINGYGLNLVFDPSKSSTADYKVICIMKAEDTSLRQIGVYSSDTSSWRVSVDSFSPPRYVLFQAGVLWNNALNWTGHGEYSLSYDIQAERLCTTPLPPDTRGRKIMYFGASQGHLHLIEAYGSLTTEFDILEMEHDFSRWSVRYHVNLNTVKKAFPEMVVPNNTFNRNGHHLEYSVISLLRGAEEGEVMLMINIPCNLLVPGKILSYRIRDGTFVKVCNLRTRFTEGNIIRRLYSYYDAFPYMSIVHSFLSSSSFSC